jgi:hypothetical protein
MAIGDEPPARITILDWAELFAREDDADALIPGIAFRGRWTALAAPAKSGKSTLLVGLAYEATKAGHAVLYVDAEMGRTDMLDRVEAWMHLQPSDLERFHYTDLPPKLDNHQGADMLLATVEDLKPDLVIIDGLNGVIYGAENDDTPWRDLYELSIAPLKALNVAVVTSDNTGHADKKRPRGSSVKIDKADAILALERTQEGVTLTCELRRTAAYPTDQHYLVRFASEEGPAMTVTPANGHGPPDGTDRVVATLDRLGADDDISVRAAARLIREHGAGAKQAVIAAAVKTRQNRVTGLWVTPSETPSVSGVTRSGVYVVTPALNTVDSTESILEEQF